MAKKGMARPERSHIQARNDQPPVPELSGKEKSGKKKVLPIITDSSSPSLKVYHRSDTGSAKD